MRKLWVTRKSCKIVALTVNWWSSLEYFMASIFSAKNYKLQEIFENRKLQP